MRIIHRYILVEMLKAFGLGLAAATAVVCLGMVLKALQDQGLGPITSALYMALSVPFAMYIALALAGVLAATLVYGRLTAANEVLACRASGIAVSSLLWPSIVLALAVTAVSLALAAWPLPASSRAAKQLALADIERLFFTELASTGDIRDPNKTFQLSVDGLDGSTLLGPALVHPTETGQVYVSARAGKVEFDREAHLLTMTLYDALVVDEAGRVLVRGDHTVPLQLPRSVPMRISDLPVWDLMAAQHVPERFSKTLLKLRRSKPETITPHVVEIEKARVRAKAMAELHGRLAAGLGCLGLVVLGAGLGVLFHSGHLLTAFGVALAPWLLSTILTQTGVDVVASHREVPAAVLYLVWAPNLAMVALALATSVYLVFFWSHPARRPRKAVAR